METILNIFAVLHIAGVIISLFGILLSGVRGWLACILSIASLFTGWGVFVLVLTDQLSMPDLE